MKSFLKTYSMAFESLTIFHVGSVEYGEKLEKFRPTVFYPVVGLFLGVILNFSRLFLQTLLPNEIAEFLTIILLVGFTGGIHLVNLASGIEVLIGNSFGGRQNKLSVGGLSLFSISILTFIQGLKFFTLIHVPSNLISQAVVLLPMAGLWVMLWVLCFPAPCSEVPIVFSGNGSWREFVPASIIAFFFLSVFLKLKAFPVIFIMAVFSFILTKLSGNRKELALALGVSHELGGIIFLFSLGLVSSIKF